MLQSEAPSAADEKLKVRWALWMSHSAPNSRRCSLRESLDRLPEYVRKHKSIGQLSGVDLGMSKELTTQMWDVTRDGRREKQRKLGVDPLVVGAVQCLVSLIQVRRYPLTSIIINLVPPRTFPVEADLKSSLHTSCLLFYRYWPKLCQNVFPSSFHFWNATELESCASHWLQTPLINDKR